MVCSWIDWRRHRQPRRAHSQHLPHPPALCADPLTQIRNTQKASKHEITLGLIDKASWHDRYRHSAYVFAGGLPYELTEGDVLAVFSQYGEVLDLKLVRDKKTGACWGIRRPRCTAAQRCAAAAGPGAGAAAGAAAAVKPTPNPFPCRPAHCRGCGRLAPLLLLWVQAGRPTPQPLPPVWLLWVQASPRGLPSWPTRTSAARCWRWTTSAGRRWRGG